MPRIPLMLPRIKSIFIFMCAISASAAYADAPKNEWLILDGVRHFSYNMVCCLVDNNIPCTVLVRPKDLMHADARLPRSPLITIVEADYAAPQRPEILDTMAAGAKYIFLDPEDDTFATWHDTVLTTTRNALYIAKKHKLHLFYPARIYPFNPKDLITEQSTFDPISAQGRTSTKIEYMLKFASDNHHCKVTKIRTSYAFGPAIYDYLLSSTFKDVPQLGRMTWLFRTDKPHQFVYAYDVARLALLLSSYELTIPESYSLTVHFSGYTYESVEAFGKAICAVAGVTLKQRIVGKFLLSLICLSEPNAQRGSDVSAHFDTPSLLQDSSILTEVLKFEPTKPEVAIAKTLEWFKQHPETRGIFHKNR